MAHTTNELIRLAKYYKELLEDGQSNLLKLATGKLDKYIDNAEEQAMELAKEIQHNTKMYLTVKQHLDNKALYLYDVLTSKEKLKIDELVDSILEG